MAPEFSQQVDPMLFDCRERAKEISRLFRESGEVYEPWLKELYESMLWLKEDWQKEQVLLMIPSQARVKLEEIITAEAAELGQGLGESELSGIKENLMGQIQLKKGEEE